MLTRLMVTERTPAQTMAVDLYYYNQPADLDADGQPRCSPAAVLPVERTISSDQPIDDTIRLLLRGQVTADERQAGFNTEFPNRDFKLLDVDLENSVLTLTFNEVPGFTTGGACRTDLLRAQIEKTALQFAAVSEVVIRPISLFQP
jgi:hypothetical protein